MRQSKPSPSAARCSASELGEPSSPSGHRFLVLGCGSIGQRHIRNLQALNQHEILAFDPRADRGDDLGSQLSIQVIGQMDQAWEWGPDVAIITAPTSMHLSLALEAARQGCHLFIEKPLSHRTEGLPELLDVVKEQELVTLIGCNLRFHPGIQAIKRLLHQRAVGRVVAARVEVGQYLPDWHPWEDYRTGYSAQRDLGGGVMLDAIHEIDYITWLLGPVREVCCFMGKLSHLEIDTEDTAALLLRFADGAIGEVHLDYVQRHCSRTCQIIGDEGTIRWDYSAGEVSWYDAASRSTQIESNPADWQPNQMYVDEMEHFLRCLGGVERPTLDVFGAAAVLEVALAAKRAAETHQIVTLGA